MPTRATRLTQNHWNGCHIVPFTLRTNGRNTTLHEVVELCGIPLDADLKQRKEVMPLCLQIAPLNPQYSDFESGDIARNKIAKLAIAGIDAEQALRIFFKWRDKLGIKTTKYGTPYKIIPVYYDAGLAIPFMQAFFTRDLYFEFFHDVHIDLKSVCRFINDRAAYRIEDVPISKYNLSFVASALEIEHQISRDCLEDCDLLAKCYRQLVSRGVWV